MNSGSLTDRVLQILLNHDKDPQNSSPVLRRVIESLSRYGRPAGRLIAARARGAACPRCGRALRTATVGGRTSYYCGFCQR